MDHYLQGGRVSMKKRMICLLALAAVSLCACGKQKAAEDVVPSETKQEESGAESETEAVLTSEDTESTESESEQKEETQPADAASEIAEEIDYEAAYAQILQKYSAAFAEEWDADRLSEEKLCQLIAYTYSEDAYTVGYTLLDLDENGTKELLICMKSGEETASALLGAYTLTQEEPCLLFTAGERENYTLCEDMGIYSQAALSALETNYTLYRLEGDFLYNEKEIAYNARTDEENPWFLVDGENYEPITEEEALDGIRNWEDSLIGLDMTEF